METLHLQGDGKDPQGATVADAAKVFEARLFPEGGEQAETSPDAGEQPDEPAAPPTSEEPEAGKPADAEPESKPTPRSRKLKFGDEEEEVSEDEAYLGYMRTRDYTQKTQALAEERRRAEAEQRQTREARAQYSQALEAAKRSMDALIPREPNWAEMRAKGATDAQIAEAAATYQEWKSERDRIEAEQTRIAKEVADEHQKELDARAAAEESKLLEKLPEWRDPAVGKAEREKLYLWLRDKQGFTEDQIESIADHRLIVSMYHDMLFEDAQEKKSSAQPRRSTTRTLAPQPASPPKKPVDETARRKAQLAKSGKTSDAAKVFELLDI